MHFTGTKPSPLVDSSAVQAQKMLSPHGGFLTIAMYHHKQYNQLTHYDETERRAHDSHIVRAKENLEFGHGGSIYSQASGTNLSIKALRQSRH